MATSAPTVVMAPSTASHVTATMTASTFYLYGILSALTKASGVAMGIADADRAGANANAQAANPINKALLMCVSSRNSRLSAITGASYEGHMNSPFKLGHRQINSRPRCVLRRNVSLPAT